MFSKALFFLVFDRAGNPSPSPSVRRWLVKVQVFGRCGGLGTCVLAGRPTREPHL